MATPLTSPITLSGAVTYDLRVLVDFDQQAAVITLDLRDSSGVVIRTISRSRTFLELGITAPEASAFRNRVVNALKTQGDIN